MAELMNRFTLRLPNSLHKYLTVCAKEQQRSLNNLIVHILTEDQRKAELSDPYRRFDGAIVWPASVASEPLDNDQATDDKTN